MKSCVLVFAPAYPKPWTRLPPPISSHSLLYSLKTIGLLSFQRRGVKEGLSKMEKPTSFLLFWTANRQYLLGMSPPKMIFFISFPNKGRGVWYAKSLSIWYFNKETNGSKFAQIVLVRLARASASASASVFKIYIYWHKCSKSMYININAQNFTKVGCLVSPRY